MLQPPSYVLHITPLSPTVNANAARWQVIYGKRTPELQGFLPVVESGGLLPPWADGKFLAPASPAGKTAGDRPACAASTTFFNSGRIYRARFKCEKTRKVRVFSPAPSNRERSGGAGSNSAGGV